MRLWVKRPIEIRNLFNPAFCGLVLHRALSGFCAGDNRGMPFSLTLLVLPLCLQQRSREILQNGNRSYFLKLITQHPELLVGFPKQCTDVMPFTFEGLGLLMYLDAIDVTESGCLIPGKNPVHKSLYGGAESKSCQRVANYLGKQFAMIGDRGTIYTTLGVRP